MFLLTLDKYRMAWLISLIFRKMWMRWMEHWMIWEFVEYKNLGWMIL